MSVTYKITQSTPQAITVMTTNEAGALTRDGIAQLEFHQGIYDDLYYFNRLKVYPTGQGLGSRVLAVVLQEAQRHGRGIWCDPNPYDGERRMADLVRFYLRHGFEWTGELNKRYLLWLPQQQRESKIVAVLDYVTDAWRAERATEGEE
jgi:GNAT superfamily N-acetyltransferase